MASFLQTRWKSRSVRAFDLRIAMAVILAAFMTWVVLPLSGLVSIYGHELLQKFVSDLEGTNPFTLFLDHTTLYIFKLSSAGQFIAQIPAYVIILTLRKSFGERIADTLIAPFDLEIMRKIARAKPIDPLRGSGGGWSERPLPWLKTKLIEQKYSKLIDFAYQYSRLGDRKKADFQTFSVMLVVGSLGSGKSRLAMQVARSLANRSEGGNDTPETGLATRIGLRWRSYRNRFRDNDPWDAGWLTAEAVEEAIGDISTFWPRRPRVAQGKTETKLSQWRPRQPTILILDDPKSGDASKVIEILLKSSESADAPYLHPVRLIIVSQAAPDDLALKWADGRWSTDEDQDSTRATIRGVISLGQQTRFTALDILTVSYAVFGQSGNPVRNGAQNQIAAITGGNPLLVEIAFHRFREDHARGAELHLENLTVDDLLAGRVQRWKEAVETHIKGKRAARRAWHALAAATLAAGAYGSAPRGKIEEILEGATPDADELRALFPNADVNLELEIPAMRPTRIGDAFTLAALADCRFDRATEDRLSEAECVMAAAWNADASSTLDTIIRLASVANPAKDPIKNKNIQTLLICDPVEHLRIKVLVRDPASMARAWALAAARVSRDNWDAGLIVSPSALIQKAVARINALTPKEADLSLDDFISRLPIEGDTWVVAGREALYLVDQWLGRALDNAAPWSTPKAWRRVVDIDKAMWSIVTAWGVVCSPPGCDWTSRQNLSKSYAQAARSLALPNSQIFGKCSELIDQIAGFGFWAPHDNENGYAATSLRGLSLILEKTGDRNKFLECKIKEYMFSREYQLCEESVSEFACLINKTCIAKAASIRDLVRSYSLNGNVKKSEFFLLQVIKMAEEQPNVPQINIVLLQTLEAMAYSYELNKNERNEVVEFERIKYISEFAEKIAVPLLTDAKSREACARPLCRIWISVGYAFATYGNTEFCEKAAARIEYIIVLAGQESNVFQRLRAMAIRNTLLAYAHSNNEVRPSGLTSDVEKVLNTSQAHAQIDLAKAQSVSSVFVIYNKERPDLAVYRSCLRFVENVDALFNGDYHFSLAKADSLSLLALTYDARGQFLLCIDACNRAKSCLDPFINIEEVAQMVAMIWSILANAHCGVDTTETNCKMAVDQVELLVADQSNKLFVSRTIGEACVSLCYMHMRTNNKIECKATAERVMSVSEEYAGDKDIERNVCAALEIVAFMERDDPRAFAEVVAKIKKSVLASNNDQMCQKKLDAALRYQRSYPVERASSPYVARPYTIRHLSRGFDKA